MKILTYHRLLGHVEVHHELAHRLDHGVEAVSGVMARRIILPVASYPHWFSFPPDLVQNALLHANPEVVDDLVHIDPLMVVHRSSTADGDVQLAEELNDLGNIFVVSIFLDLKNSPVNYWVLVRI